jgi:hypothetical protein
MADRVEIRDFTIPAGTLRTALLSLPLVWRQGYPVRVELRFPPGPSGLVGVRLLHSGLPVVPKDGSDFLVTDNEVVDWEVILQNYQPRWTAQGYNEGLYPHTVQIRMHLNEIGSAAIARVQNVPITLPATSTGNLLEGLEVP